DGRGARVHERAASSWRSRPGSPRTTPVVPSPSCPFASRSSSIPATSAEGCGNGPPTWKTHPGGSGPSVVTAVGLGSRCRSHGCGRSRSLGANRVGAQLVVLVGAAILAAPALAQTGDHIACYKLKDRAKHGM